METVGARRLKLVLNVAAAYNREELPIPRCSGMNVNTIEEMLDHPYHWAYLSEREQEDILMEIYVARRRWMQ